MGTFQRKITILTQEPGRPSLFSLSEFLLRTKALLFFLTRNRRFQHVGGPSRVVAELLRGFMALRVDYVLNPKPEDVTDTVCVISGVPALRWAIAAKKRGLIKKLVAGPNVAMPLDENGLIFNEMVDVFLVPAQWVKDFCCSFKPDFCKNIMVWASGVYVSETPKKRSEREGCLIFKKNGDERVFEKVTSVLQKRQIPFRVITYGAYYREDYLRLLRDSKFLIYLSKSESQGLALHEAWAHDVPTLVWNGEHLKTLDYEWPGSSPAPYLHEETGMFFDDTDVFEESLQSFLSSMDRFSPRRYHLKHFTPEVSARRFLDIISGIFN